MSRFPLTTHQPPPHKGTTASARCDNNPPNRVDPPHDVDDPSPVSPSPTMDLVLVCFSFLFRREPSLRSK
ncbi:hypothetical protein JHK82_046470 [Glycine max]|uniref:Uncharacterized protein n=1 Tax=Glycine max TaxID=3847 RepID=A0A0R0FHH7_SOYBN|nr:hypothetical protein JHK87_046146 [Glycine soja]KAG4942271.1 hypothetical protein JHK85_046917 [Glycine max]KAG5096616.1 hypothetical protein JHK82_046470 [Glycine max]KAG5101406.1 hypothetical protein JHK84_046375 [Glycine max]KAH1116557.1 hypothetical protein GYH30_046117 [Glycine max]